MGKSLLCLLISFFAGAAVADAGAERNRIRFPEDGVFAEPAVESSPWRFSWSLLGGIRRHVLSGEGFHGETPDSGQGATRASLEWETGSWSTRLALEASRTDYRELPTALTPTQIMENETALSFRTLASGSSWAWGFAGRYETSGADTTRPNVLISSSSSLWLGGALSKQWGPGGAFRMDSALLVPVALRESSVRTGDFAGGARWELGGSVQAGGIFGAELRGGAELAIQSVFFRGDGSRGTSAARESSVDLRFPLELTWSWR